MRDTLPNWKYDMPEMEQENKKQRGKNRMTEDSSLYIQSLKIFS